MPLNEQHKRTCKHWTPEEDNRLRAAWGEKSIPIIAATLKRTPRATCLRANVLGLPTSCPEGYERLSHAAQRVGYDIDTFKKVLADVDVEIELTYAFREDYDDRTGTIRKVRHQIVRTSEIDAAVAYRASTETLRHAAQARGMLDETLKTILVAEGLTPPENFSLWSVPVASIKPKLREALREAEARHNVKIQRRVLWWKIPSVYVKGYIRQCLDKMRVQRPRAKRVVWRIPTEDIEAALNRHTAKRAQYESLKDAAKRFNVHHQTMYAWIKATGHRFERRGVPREVVDRAVHAKKGKSGERETLKEASKRLCLSEEKISRCMREAGIPFTRGARYGILTRDINRVITKVLGLR